MLPLPNIPKNGDDDDRQDGAEQAPNAAPDAPKKAYAFMPQQAGHNRTTARRRLSYLGRPLSPCPSAPPKLKRKEKRSRHNRTMQSTTFTFSKPVSRCLFPRRPGFFSEEELRQLTRAVQRFFFTINYTQSCRTPTYINRRRPGNNGRDPRSPPDTI